MDPSLGDAETSTARMGQIQPGDVPASRRQSATPIRNGDAHSNGDAHPNGDFKNGSRTATLSPGGDGSRSNGGSDASPPPRPSRKGSQKAARREPPLFNDAPDVTEEACSSFKVIADCLYGSKNMGSAANDAQLDCDCREDWHDGINYACAEDCINRATRLECIVGASGSCGDFCQNQRFQRKLYANISIIKTEKKGYGLRANVDLEVNDFIHEYVGEVINEPTFRRRMVQYDDEGIKHFYFMSLRKNEFVDATKKGGLGRFCNHSCEPNCYVDKWVVGDKLRMGIFVLRQIRAGEELTFNYNVDRYGADPQPCYCGEPDCVGYIGGRTQTERATKLPPMVVEALGIDDADGWDTAVKKPRKKRPDEEDEDYVNSLQSKGLTVDGVRNVMACLFQSKEKWIIVKVLERIQHTDDPEVLAKVVQLHVYKIMKLLIITWVEDDNVILQVLGILAMLPRLTKNKIVDSGIESHVRDLTGSENPDIAEASKKLTDEWDALEVGYRIKRRKADPSVPRTATAGALRSAVFGGDRDTEPSTPSSKPVSPLPTNVEIPKGPKSNIPQRNPHAAIRPRRFVPPHPVRPRPGFPHENKRPEDRLPAGWFQGANSNGVPYYYNAAGVTTWEVPKAPADPMTRTQAEAQIIQKIIDDANRVPAEAKAAPEASGSEARQEGGSEKWRSLPIEKQMKIYENTIFPHVKYVLDKFRHKLPKEELKRLAKDVNKKLAASDYKNKRVRDPTAALQEGQARKIKLFVKSYLDKAVAKYHGQGQGQGQGHERQREPDASAGANGEAGVVEKGDVQASLTPEIDSTPELANGVSPSSPGLKRKREGVSTPATPVDEEERLAKRAREPETAPPPPPPPPPPPEGVEMITEEERDLRAQELELMRENEEAQRLEDEAKGGEVAAVN